MSRCWPRAVPAFPPTGALAAGSLNPSPGPSLLTTVMVAASATGEATAAMPRSAAITRQPLDRFLRNTLDRASPFGGEALLLLTRLSRLVEMVKLDLPVR